MKVNRIDVLVSTHANKQRTYLYNELFGLAKEHQVSGRFGNDYIELSSVPEPMISILDKLKIVYNKIKK